MANKNLLNAALIVAEQRKKEAEERNKEIESSKVLKGFPKVVSPRTDEPLYFTNLTSAEDMINVFVHFEWVEAKSPKEKGRYEYHICNKTFQQLDPSYPDDNLCGQLDDRGRKKFSSLVKAMVVYVPSFEGRTYCPDPATGKEYPLSPEKVLLYRAGKGMANFSAFDELNRKNSFAPGKNFIFQVSKTGTGTETVYSPISVVHPDFLGDEFDPNSASIKKAKAEWANKTTDQIWQALLSVFKGVDWALWGVDAPKADSVESEDKSDTTKPAGKKSKDALN